MVNLEVSPPQAVDSHGIFTVNQALIEAKNDRIVSALIRLHDGCHR